MPVVGDLQRTGWVEGTGSKSWSLTVASLPDSVVLLLDYDLM